MSLALSGFVRDDGDGALHEKSAPLLFLWLPSCFDFILFHGKKKIKDTKDASMACAVYGMVAYRMVHNIYLM